MPSYTDINKAEREKKEQKAEMLSIEEKVDKILKYTKAARRWSIVRGIISIIFLLVFIVGPVIGGVYLFRWINTQIDFEEVGNQYTEFQDTLKGLKDKAAVVEDAFKDIPN